MRNTDFKKCFVSSWPRTAAICVAAAMAMPAAFAQQGGTARSAGSVSASTPYMGVGIMDVDDTLAKTFKMKEARGAVITQLDPAGPAAKAGLKINDVILEYDGQHVEGKEQLPRLVRETVPGHSVKLGVWRNGAMITVEVNIELHRNMPMEVVIPRGVWGVDAPDYWPMGQMSMDIPLIQTVMQNPILGVECEVLGDQRQFAEFFGVKDGLLVKKVGENSAAAHAGIKAGDVIVKVDDMHVATMPELNSSLRMARQKPPYQVTVVRNKKEMPLTVQAP